MKFGGSTKFDIKALIVGVVLVAVGCTLLLGTFLVAEVLDAVSNAIAQ